MQNVNCRTRAENFGSVRRHQHRLGLIPRFDTQKHPRMRVSDLHQVLVEDRLETRVERHSKSGFSREALVTEPPRVGDFHVETHAR